MVTVEEMRRLGQRSIDFRRMHEWGLWWWIILLTASTSLYRSSPLQIVHFSRETAQSRFSYLVLMIGWFVGG